MFGFATQNPVKADHAACSGCSLCLLACPVWRATRDLRLTPHGRSKALQHGATITDITPSVESCTLCSACEPVCPENIDLVGMITGLRRQLPRSAALQGLQTRMEVAAARPGVTQYASRGIWLPGAALRRHPETMAKAAALLKNSGAIVVSDDDGSDIALALEAGVAVPAQRLERFLAPLRRLKKIIIADGLLLRHLKSWLPKLHAISLGEALSGLAVVRRGLRASDLYVIEPRAYHADHQRLVTYYDRLRNEAGCATNLDLQRIAIPATARNLRQRLGLEAADDSTQAQWVLHGRKVARIVVENVEDMAAFNAVSDCPVVHVVDLADDGKMNASIQSL